MDPEQPEVDYTSVEEIAAELECWLKQHGYNEVSCLFGCSMGGAVVAKMLANGGIRCRYAIMDGGMTPYRLPRLLTYCIAIRDWCMVELGKHAGLRMLRSLFPEEKCSEDDLIYIRKCLRGMSAKTVWRAFYSCNNYKMPPQVEKTSCKIQYWYGSEEKKARKWDIEYIVRTFPQIECVENPGIAHAEFFTRYPQRFTEQLFAFCAMDN
jgi:pimeloyl-ACP methyl ester carboxylesterase